MRHGSGKGLNYATLMLSAAVTCGIGAISQAKAQEAAAADQLPPVEVVSSQKAAKKKPAKKKTAQINKPEPAEPSPPSNQPVTIDATGLPAGTSGVARPGVKVSGEPSIGTNSTDITSEDIERINPTDIQDVFKGQPGIQVGSSIPTSQKVYVNGVEETNLAVTVDGSRQNNKVFHHSGTNLIDPALLKAARVDAGVAPADAGPGALAGSIAYETKDARDLLLPGQSMGGFISGSYETNGDIFRTGASAYGLSGPFEILGYINYADGDNFEDGNGKEVSGTAPKLLSGLGKVALQADTGDRFQISHERVTDDGLRPFRSNLVNVNPRPAPPDRVYDTERQNTVFTYTDRTPSGWWDPKLVVAYSATKLSIPDPARSVGETDSLNGKFENKFSLSNGNVIAGIDFFDDEAAYKDSDVIYNGSEKATNVGIYAQARLSPFERTRVSFGGRGDNVWFEGADGSKFEESGLSGNVSGEYDLTDFLTAKAGYGHVWGGIPLAEPFVASSFTGYGNGPEPVISDNYTAGLVATFGGLVLDGSVFRTQINDARNPIFFRGGPLQAFDLDSEGFEVGARYNWLGGFASIRYTNADVTLDGRPIDTYYGSYIGTPMGDFISIALSHEFIGTGITVGGDVQIAFENDDPLKNSGNPDVCPCRVIPGYEVVNLFAQYVPTSMDHLTFRLDAKNIFDETYVSRATYGQEFVGLQSLYEPGRSFMLSAKARF